MSAHNPWDLKQMQSLPLESKILMTKQRIRSWCEAWTRFEIYDKATGKTRSVTWDTRDRFSEPPMKETEYIEAVFPNWVCVSFSGGKDSTVLKHIVDSMADDIPSVFVNTGLEYPEIQKFVRDIKSGKWDCFNSDVEILRPEMRFDEVLKTYGYPVIGKRQADAVELARKNIADGKYSVRLRYLGVSIKEAKMMGLSLPSFEMLDRYEKAANGSKFAFPKYKYLLEADFDMSAKCCDVMKKKPSKLYQKRTGRKQILATMACESLNRESAWLKNGCNGFEAKNPSSQPMAFWTEQDVLHYIKKFDVPFCPVYGEIRVKQSEEADKDQINLIDYLQCYDESDILETSGCNRTGCIFCMFGCHLEEEPNRFQRLKETHPRQWEYCIKGGEMVGGKWQPNKYGLGLGHVLDFIGVKYE